ncbi:hypothetical protein OY671_002375, partial [Metschnikowia pulcherrima]
GPAVLPARARGRAGRDARARDGGRRRRPGRRGARGGDTVIARTARAVRGRRRDRPADAAPPAPDAPIEDDAGGCVVRLEDVHVRLGERDVSRGVSLESREHRVGVVGANGSGKSTSARSLNGLVVPTAGRVLVDGLDTRRQGAAVRRRVGFVFTDPDAQIVMPTVAEDVAYSSRGVPADERAAVVRRALAARGLAEHADHPAHSLSGGQKQLLALTSVLAAGPRLVVADEPTTLLDSRNTRRVAAELASLPQQVVLVSHDLALMDAMDRVLVVDGGRVVADDAPGPAVAHYRRSLVGLATASGAVSLVSSPVAVGVVVVVVAALYALAGVGARAAWEQVRPSRLVVPVLLAVQWFALGPAAAVVLTTRLVALVALAGLVSLTTRTAAVLAAIERGSRPLGRVGVDVGRVALVSSLAVRSVPVVAALAQRVRDACRARGREHDVRAFAVPLVVGVSRQADALGDASRARGLDD